MSSDNKVRVLAVDVLSEIEATVETEVARIRASEASRQKVLTEQQAETLHNVYFAAVGRAVLDHYTEQGVVVKNRSYLRTLIDFAQMAVEVRASEIDMASDVEVTQFSDARLSDRMSEATGTGMSVRSQGWTAEDFYFGMPPAGGRFLPVFRKPDYEKLGERVRQGYSAEGKSPEEILDTMPRKYRSENQTYVLDVRKTLEAAHLSSISPGYHIIERALIDESRNPEMQDRLRKMYAEIELREIDEMDEIDDE
ncbi:hypothetical protein KY359_04130 [Candidatus Woesearchaeota archaeon]|nr:hypothetical protein [Candidatus Woesearchaeota archaeon]